MHFDPSSNELRPDNQQGESSTDMMSMTSAYDPAMEIKGINRESIIIFCGINRSDFYKKYKDNKIYNDIDKNTSELLPEGLLVVHFQPCEISKHISPKNSDDLAARHAKALFSKKGGGMATERNKALKITEEACKYVEPELLAYFEKYGVEIDVREPHGIRAKSLAWYDSLAKKIYISPSSLNAKEPVRSSSGKVVDTLNPSVDPIHVGTEIHEFGHAFNQLLTRLPNYPDLPAFKKWTPEQKRRIPFYKRERDHLQIGEALFKKVQTDSGKSSIPLFPSMDEMSKHFVSAYANEFLDEIAADLFRLRAGVPHLEFKLPKEIPADLRTTFFGDNGHHEFVRFHRLQLPDDRKLVRAFGDRYASEAMDRMDGMCKAVIEHVRSTPELLDRSLHPENYDHRPRPLDIKIFGDQRAISIAKAINQWSKGNAFPWSIRKAISKLQKVSASTSTKAAMRPQIDDPVRSVAKPSSLPHAAAPLQPSKIHPLLHSSSPDVSAVTRTPKISKTQVQERG